MLDVGVGGLVSVRHRDAPILVRWRGWRANPDLVMVNSVVHAFRHWLEPPRLRVAASFTARNTRCSGVICGGLDSLDSTAVDALVPQVRPDAIIVGSNRPSPHRVSCSEVSINKTITGRPL